MKNGSPRLVLALGTEARDAAREASARRGADYADVSSASELFDRLRLRTGSALVFTTFARFSSRSFLALVDVVAREAPELALGLLPAVDAEGLAEWARALPPEPNIGSPLVGQPCANSSRLTLTGARLVTGSDSQSTMELLLRPSELCFIAGHSGGTHMGVGGVLVCRQPSLEGKLTDHRAFPCFFGEKCGPAHTGSTKGDPVLDAERIASRRVVMLTCFGALLSDGPYNPTTVILEGLLRNGVTESVITPCRALPLANTDAAAAYFGCNRGWPLGRVANHMNRLRIQAGLQAEYACFGDPESRVDGSVQTATVESAGAGMRIEHSLFGAADVCVAIDEHEPHATSVVIDRSPTPIGSVLVDPGGTLLAHVGPEGAHLEVVALDDLASVDDLVTVSEGARFLGHCVQSARRVVGDSSPLVGEATKALQALHGMLDSWPLAGLHPGAVLSGSDLDGIRGLWRLRLERVQLTTAHLYLQMAARRGSLSPAGLWQDFYVREQFLEQRGECPGCGAAQDVSIWRCKTRSHRYQTGYCHSCGPVREGPDVTAARLRILKASRTAVEIEIDCVNPAATPVPGHVLFMVPPFVPDGEQPRFESRSLSPMPQETVVPVRIPLELEPPPIPGIHYLCAAVFIGSSLSYFRIPYALE